MSEFNQASFSGGMNLLVDDTRLGPNEYREAFNVRNRFDVLGAINEATEDVIAPAGLKQGLYSFGDYLIAFVAGNAYYRFRSATGWQQIDGFSMNPTVSRYYVAVVPVSTTNYGRLGVEDGGGTLRPNSGINLANIASAIAGLPGLLVQDGINQAQFIYIDTDLVVKCRTTKKFSEWFWSDTVDSREYVPVGTFMEWVDGILYIVSPSFNEIYRSVSGRPLDFVVNVKSDGTAGGDATTTSYSVGLGGISCIKALNSGGLFVCASGTCFLVTPNRTPNAPTLFAEPTFIRQFLFTSKCLSDKVIIDLLGDTAFIDPEGLRSFNAVLQLQNEGRNNVFSLKVASLFNGLLQNAETTAATTFDNYALFGVNTVYGYVIVVYDTLNECFCGMDTIVGSYVKQFAKIETDVTEIYCITGDDKMLKLYSSATPAKATVRLQGMCASAASQTGAVVQTPTKECQLTKFRCVLSGYRQNSTITVSPFVNNCWTGVTSNRSISYKTPVNAYGGSPSFADIGSNVTNELFTFANCMQGWKAFILLSWTGGGYITNVQAELKDLTPMQPLRSQPISV